VLEVGETFRVSGEEAAECVATTVVSDEQVGEVPEYQVTVNGVAPPDHVALRVTDWPLSMTGDEGVMLPGDIRESTDTRSVREEAVGGFVELSVTV
jgi:hypothetical protein